MALTYEEISLSWRPDHLRDSIFTGIVIFALILFVAVGVFLSRVPVPKEKQERRIPIPERIARFINEQPKPKPILQPKPKVLPVPPPIPKQFVKPRKKIVKKPLTKIQKTARKKAEKSGLLALTKQLSGLVDTSGIDKMVGNHIRRGANIHAKANVNSKILTAQAGKGQVGVSQHLQGAVGGTTVLDNDQRNLARKLLASNGGITTIHHHRMSATNEQQNGPRGDNLRSEEDVAYVMDEHKSILHMLYRRARRRHPDLKGKIVFKITILPSGKVSHVQVISSELHDSSLVRDLIARIRLFDFGARHVEALTVTVPVEFMPS